MRTAGKGYGGSRARLRHTFLRRAAWAFRDYVHVEVNAAFERHLGIPHVAGQTLRDIAPDAETDGWLALYGDVLRTGRSIRFERLFAPTGRHLELAAHRVEPASRREVAVLFADITLRKRAEADLRASEERLRTHRPARHRCRQPGGMNGRQMADTDRERRPDLKVLFITGNAENAILGNGHLKPAYRS